MMYSRPSHAPPSSKPYSSPGLGDLIGQDKRRCQGVGEHREVLAKHHGEEFRPGIGRHQIDGREGLSHETNGARCHGVCAAAGRLAQLFNGKGHPVGRRRAPAFEDACKSRPHGAVTGWRWRGRGHIG